MTRQAIDRTVDLDINGSRQRIRLCAERDGRPPLLIVQGGPGLPLLNDVPKFQRLLNLERDFLVGYWEQRGCGNAPSRETENVSLRQQVADLRAVLRWFSDEANQSVTVLAISLGGTSRCRRQEELRHVKALVTVSPDSQTAVGDAAADVFIRTRGAVQTARGLRKGRHLAAPPCLDPAQFQRRASLLADLGAIERGKTFNALLRETLFSMLRTYGVVGTVKALRNMPLILRTMLRELVSLDLFANPPRLAMSVHYLFGEQDALTPRSVVKDLPAAIAAPASTVRLLPNAGHMVHFDQPDIVRKVTVSA
jgi:pimeloyl-ACP methyl ester carboxylesterase